MTEQQIRAPEHGWLRSGIFLSCEQKAIIDEARRHERITTLDGDDSYSITKSYKFHLRQFAKDAGLPSAAMVFEVTEDGELLIARWKPPNDQGPILDLSPN